jgi:hypothetical protein
MGTNVAAEQSVDVPESANCLIEADLTYASVAKLILELW